MITPAPAAIPLVPILQTAISPSIIISGVGLLLLTMTNRLGRVIDRARLLDSELARLSEPDREKNLQQLRILWQRARLIRLAIGLSAASALSAAVLILTLFFIELCPFNGAGLIATLFILSISCLVASLSVFIHDINRTLAALKHELADAGVGFD